MVVAEKGHPPMSMRRTTAISMVLGLTLLGLPGCGGTQQAEPDTGAGGRDALSPIQAVPTVAPGDNVATTGMTPVAGQAATCGGPRRKTFDVEVIESTIALGGGTTFAAWTYAGGIPGPTLEVCEGDEVTINVINRGTTAHGLDTHAFRIDARQYGPTNPGTTLTIEKTVDRPGVYMYHCASGAVTDLHIKSGLHGAMIVYPRDRPLRPAREMVIVQSAVYGQPDRDGFIPGTDPNMTLRNEPSRLMFNGYLAHEPVPVRAGELMRVYFVNVGPGVSAVHVIGTIFDRVYDGQEPVRGVQTWAVPAGSGAIFEFIVPEAGLFHFVDHDRLAYLPLGSVISFEGEGAETTQ